MPPEAAWWGGSGGGSRVAAARHAPPLWPNPGAILRAAPQVPVQVDHGHPDRDLEPVSSFLDGASGRGLGVLHGGCERLGAVLHRGRIHPHDLPAVSVEVEEAA